MPLSEQLPAFMPGPKAMLFHSFEYLLVFLPAVACLYFCINRRQWPETGKLWLVIASLFFYGWWSLGFLWLIAGSMTFNFLAGRWLGRLHGRGAPTAGRCLLVTAVAGNLLLLGYYKYADFFIASANQLSGTTLPLLELALPLGISFFTFTQIAFLVDTHQGKAKEANPVHYALFVTYFPHLIAGPILHHSEMMPQFASRAAGQVNWSNIQQGLFILSIGVLKKTLLADSLAPAADAGFSSPNPLLMHEAWVASLSYTLQLYFDFSAYTDMAIGASLLFNIRLPANFNSPYQAKSIQDFWRRWHMTLSRWLRDYLYVPLGGNRHGELRTQAALLVTFLLGGLWHGANWTFVVWGAMHGAASVIHRLWHRAGLHMPGWLGWCMTFLFVHTAWIFFRAPTLGAAWQMLQSLVGRHGLAEQTTLLNTLHETTQAATWEINMLSDFHPARAITLVVIGLALAWLTPNTQALYERFKRCQRGWMVVTLLSAAIGTALFSALFLSPGIGSFIYFYF